MDSFRLSFPGVKHNDTVKLDFVKTDSGWHLSSNGPHSGDCEPDGSRLLSLNLSQNNTVFPSSLDSYLGHIWQGLNSRTITTDDAQRMFLDLSAWITATNEATPEWQGYNV